MLSYPFTIDLEQPDYVIVDGLTAGTVLRHELIHVGGKIVEYDTDLETLQKLQEASAAHRREENPTDAGYWIVFETSEGLTITQNPQTQNSQTAA